MTQLLPYYPHLDINPLVGLKGAGLPQPPLQLASNAAQQISIPVYTPVYNQKQLVPPIKSSYSTAGPVTFTTKVSLKFAWMQLSQVNRIFVQKWLYSNNVAISWPEPDVKEKRQLSSCIINRFVNILTSIWTGRASVPCQFCLRTSYDRGYFRCRKDQYIQSQVHRRKRSTRLLWRHPCTSNLNSRWLQEIPCCTHKLTLRPRNRNTCSSLFTRSLV